MTKISIIVPVYNSQKYLSEALESALNQTCKDIEIICVDDCSTDSSYDILQEYAQKDSRVKIIKTDKNSSQGIARNKALDTAEGEYIMFLDPDDWIDLSACELLYNQATKYNNDIVIFNFSKYYEKNKHYKKVSNRIQPFINAKDRNHIIIRENNENFFIDTYLCFQICKRELIEKYNIRFSEHRFCEDDIFIVKAYLNSNSMSIVTESLYFYRIHNKSLMQNYRMYMDILETKKLCFNYIQQFCKEHNSDKILKFYLNYLIHVYIFYLNRLMKKNFVLAHKFYINARKIFKEINSQYSDNLLKDCDDYTVYKKIICLSWTKYFILFLLKHLLYLGENKEKTHKIFTILGISFKLKKGLQ